MEIFKNEERITEKLEDIIEENEIDKTIDEFLDMLLEEYKAS
ncbi:MAG: hypothetical protein ACFFCS_11275 [Candidatus Hodarchaeota archaeon]